MLAGWYEKGGPAEKVIEVGNMEVPRAGPGEVLVRLRASSISPSDYKKRATTAPSSGRTTCFFGRRAVLARAGL